MDVLLRWEGELTNARLREVFGVQIVQSSRLIAAYMAERTNAITRASARAPITPGPRFDALVEPSSPDDYFRLIEGANGGAVGGNFMLDARPRLSEEDPVLFAMILTACKTAAGVRLLYSSIRHPKGIERTIYPHSLVRAPRRWHVRAWCELRADFRDFSLGRISAATPVDAISPKLRRQDADWNKLLLLKIVAHPGFDEDRQQLMRREYFGGKPSTMLRVRKALAGYAIQDMRLAIDADHEKPPQFQLYLENSHVLGGDFPMPT
jgi:hypothetical protein